jgi:hypothetical protein
LEEDKEMTTDVNKVISELYGALIGFPSNEEERFQKIISNWKDIKIDDTLHDLHYLIPSLVKFDKYLKAELERRKGNAIPPTE